MESLVLTQWEPNGGIALFQTNMMLGFKTVVNTVRAVSQRDHISEELAP